MKIAKKDAPVAVERDGYTARWTELGGMQIAFETCAKGYNIDHLLTIFPHQKCPVEHWGYILSGRVQVKYADDSEEILEPGDVFYAQPGHAPYFLEDTEIIQFTPKREHAEMVEKVMASGLLDSK
jgi:mannose-6-phosphate isomerase-like protein (cupin superfamily)